MRMRRLLIVFTAVGALTTTGATPAAALTANVATERCATLQNGLDAFAAQALAGGVPGLVVGVGQAGRTPVVRAYGLADLEQQTPMTPDAVFRIASLTKEFTAVAILRLVADGRLDLSTRAAELLPDRAWLGEITVEQLLNHTAGLADYTEDAAGIAAKAEAHSPAQMADWIERLEPRTRFQPGTAWAYSNAHYAILGLIVEAVTGRPFAEVLRETVLSPADLKATTVDDPNDIVPGRVRGYSLLSRTPRTLRNADWIHPTVPGPAGSLRATIPDLRAWNEALYAGRIIPTDQVDRMTSPGLLSDGRTTMWGMPQEWREGLQADYAMGVFVSRSPLGRRIWHTGDIDGFASWMAHWPDVGVTAVILTNADFRSIDADAFESLVAGNADCLTAG